MNGSRCAGCSRRRFGIRAGGALAALARVAGFHDKAVSAKRKHRRRRAKRQRCHRLHLKCHPGRAEDHCCAGLSCDQTVTLDGLARRCCRPVPHGCEDVSDCCYPASCDAVAGLAGQQCCGDVQHVCTADNQCCRELRCGQAIALDGLRCCAALGAACHADGDCCDLAICNPVTLQCEFVN